MSGRMPTARSILLDLRLDKLAAQIEKQSDDLWGGFLHFLNP